MLSPTLSRLLRARTAANTAVEQVALLASSFEPASFPAHGQNRFEDEGFGMGIDEPLPKVA
jgi:hypothetical protein